MPHRPFGFTLRVLCYRGEVTDSGLILGLGANDRASTVFTRMHVQLAAAP